MFAFRLQSAVAMKGITRNMSSVVRNLDSAMTSMDLQKITAVMDKFETQFENLDVRTSVSLCIYLFTIYFFRLKIV